MEIIVSGRHMEITPAIKKYASDKASKLPRYFDRVQSIEVIAQVIAHKTDQHHELEIIVHVERSDPFVQKTTGADLYACIDEAVDKLERRLTDHKVKLRNRKHNT